MDNCQSLAPPSAGLCHVEQFLADRGFRLHKVGGVSVLVGSDRFPLRDAYSLVALRAIAASQMTTSADIGNDGTS
jgi:hypothetical protein